MSAFTRHQGDPPRDVVERIIRSEAMAGRARFDDVMGRSTAPEVVKARARAVQRILNETGCTLAALRRAWGADLRYPKRRATRVADPYDGVTLERLAWRYGPDRTAQIVAGDDPNTQNDIMAWRRLCALGGAA